MESRIQWRQVSSLLQLYCGLLCLTGRIAPALADEPVQKGSTSLDQRLQQAVEQADIAKFDQLTKNNAVHNQIGSDANGRTTLMYAARAGNMEAIHKLICLDNGKWVLNPTYASTLRLNEYIDRCDPVIAKTYGYTALMYACAGKSNPDERATIVNYLLNAGADPTKQCGYGHFTALQLAQNVGNTIIADAIERNLNVRNAEKAEAKTRDQVEKAEARIKNEQNKWYNRFIFKSLTTISSILTIGMIPVVYWLALLRNKAVGSLQHISTAAIIQSQVETHLQNQADYKELSPDNQRHCLREVHKQLSIILDGADGNRSPSPTEIDQVFMNVLDNLLHPSKGERK